MPITITVRGVDLEVWKEFQKKIIDIYGNVYGNLGPQVTNALKLWLDRHKAPSLIVPEISIIARDHLHIVARYRDVNGSEKTIEVHGSQSGVGKYEVFLDGKRVRGTRICRLLKIDWGGDSSPRYLRRYLDKIANDKGVKIKGPPYPWSKDYP